MRALPLPRSVLAAAALAATALPAPPPLAFHPAPGLRLVKTFEGRRTLAFDELTCRMGGEDVPAEYLPDMTFDLDDTQRVVADDEYVAVSEGRPSELRRTFERISQHETRRLVVPPGDPDTFDGEGDSALEGKTVVFRRDGEGYSASFEGSGADASLLDALAEDMDLRGFLPEGEVAEGDSWTVPVGALVAVLRPGGDLAIELDDPERPQEVEREDPQGELRATFTGMREEQGAKVAVVALTGRASFAESWASDLRHVPVSDGTARATRDTEATLEGELWWDPAAGHARALHLKGDVSMELGLDRDDDQEGPDFQSTISLSGTWELAVTVENGG